MSLQSEQTPDFSLVSFAEAIERSDNTPVPGYEDLMIDSQPQFLKRLSGLRERLRAAKESGKLNLIILGTGGTFQSAETDHGYAPEGSLEESFKALNLPKDESVNLELIDLMNLDSSQMTVDHWRFLAESIVSIEEEAGDLYDGIIVTHGTDTMTRGASYLSFMLQGFPKSVIFTGSQYPARQTGTDAKDQMERSITTAKLAANPNKRIAEVMVSCGLRISRGTWATKMGDKTTNAFGPWNQPNQDFDATEWGKAAANGTLDRLAPALLDFGTGKNTGSLEFAEHARSVDDKIPYRPFTVVTHAADIIPARLTDLSPRGLAEFMVGRTATVLTQLGSATADDRLVEVALAAGNHGKAVILEAPFADSTVAAGTYAAGARITEVLPFIKRRLPTINTSPDALAAKINFLIHAEKVEPSEVAIDGLGVVFASNDLRRLYDAMETNLVGELV
ncbi:MAG: asparaginase domain-containing protein [Candidatus Saccharimonadales bacterium]